jgi:hypothetical protein
MSGKRTCTNTTKTTTKQYIPDSKPSPTIPPLKYEPKGRRPYTVPTNQVVR